MALTYGEFKGEYQHGYGLSTSTKIREAYREYQLKGTLPGGAAAPTTPTTPTTTPTTTPATTPATTPTTTPTTTTPTAGAPNSFAWWLSVYHPGPHTSAELIALQPQYVNWFNAQAFPPGTMQPPTTPTTPTVPTVPTTTVPTVPTEPTTPYPGYGTQPYFEAGEMLTAPISEYEQQALDMLQQLATQLGGMPSPWETPMGGQVEAALTSLLSGQFPMLMEEEISTALRTLLSGAAPTPMSEEIEATLTSLLSGEFPEEYFRASIEAPAQKRLEEVTLPGVREAYVGPGTFWGGERATAEAKAETDLDMMLAAIRGDLGYKARQQALAALGPALEYMGMPAEQMLGALGPSIAFSGMPAAQALGALGPGMEYMGLPLEQAMGQMAGVSTYMGAGALPRLIEQHGLDIAYQEFIRTRPENQPYMQLLASLLGIPMLGAYSPETPESPLAPLGEIAGSALPIWLQWYLGKLG